MNSFEKTIKTEGYTICVQIVGSQLVISQPHLGLINGQTNIDKVKSLNEIGEAVVAMILKIKKEIAKRTVMGQPIPPPISPRLLFDIPEYEWVTLAEAASYLKVSKSTMRRLLISDTIPYKRNPMKRYRVLRSDLDEYIKSGHPLFMIEQATDRLGED